METDKLPYKSSRTREGHSRWVDLKTGDKDDDDGEGLACWSHRSWEAGRSLINLKLEIVDSN